MRNTQYRPIMLLGAIMMIFGVLLAACKPADSEWPIAPETQAPEYDLNSDGKSITIPFLSNMRLLLDVL